MDHVRAARLFLEIVEKTAIGGWKIHSELLGHGKSALVIKAEKSGDIGALKVFDPELIERFGKDVQTARVQRELSLRGKDHPNIVRILDGGTCGATGFVFVAMECLSKEWRTLSSVLSNIPRDRVRPLIKQLADAARYLEDASLVHRDIKPDNIAVDASFEQLKLLDLGVIRPIGATPLTDDTTKPFIGTLRYSSPEFLLREETDTVEAWRALTFYQIGGVLHDLIMRHPLFHEYTIPFARLVEAVRNVQPVVEAEDIDPNTIVLCQNCLVKSPGVRSQLVEWASFDIPDRHKLHDTTAAKERVRKRRIAATDGAGKGRENNEQLRRRKQQLIRNAGEIIESLIRAICVRSGDFPALEIGSGEYRPDGLCFRITFEPSTAHVVSKYISIVFDLTLLEPDAAIFELAAAHLFSDERPREIRSHGVGSVVLYKGGLAPAVIGEALEHTLYKALDVGQQQ